RYVNYATYPAGEGGVEAVTRLPEFVVVGEKGIAAGDIDIFTEIAVEVGYQLEGQFVPEVFTGIDPEAFAVFKYQPVVQNKRLPRRTGTETKGEGFIGCILNTHGFGNVAGGHKIGDGVVAARIVAFGIAVIIIPFYKLGFNGQGCKERPCFG